jgi:hypothetical protein
MHTIRMYKGLDDTALYVVGFVTATDFAPIVACDTLGRAIILVSYMNGGEAPADYMTWTNVMQLQDGTIDINPKPGDFKRGDWVMPKETS